MKPIYNDRTHLRGISDKNIEIIYQYFKAPNIPTKQFGKNLLKQR